VTFPTTAVVDLQDAPREAAASARRGVLLWIVAAELILLYAATGRWLFDRWTMSVWNNAHGFLIPPVVGYFIWQELRPLKHLPRDASAWGFAFLIPALVLEIVDTGIGSQILSAMSVVIALPGLSLLFIGRARTKAIAFPLSLTCLMLPIPLALTEHVHLWLRTVTTYGAAHVLPLMGITVYAERTTLQFASATLQIGDGCSGFSTLYAALAVAALAAYSCNHTRGRVLALVAAAPLAIASNIIRVIILSLLVRSRGIGVLETWMHPASGVLTFVLTLPVILWIATPEQGDPS
jgi:exosortase